MKALVYLLLTQTKNRILYLKKKPGLLIFYGFIFLIVIASFIFLMIGSKSTGTTYADGRIIYLFIAGFGLMYLYIFANTGLSTGSSLFTMADVGLLFAAPVSPIKILLYGLFSAMGKAMFASIFIFYQIYNLKSLFGYGFTEIFALFIIYSVIVMFNQLLSIGIYIYSNGNQKRKNIVRLLLYGFIGAIIISAFLMIRNEQGNILEAVCRLVDSKWFGYLPGVGWSVMFFKGIVTGSMVSVGISLALFVVVSLVIILMLAGRDADYYEDVLHSTEITYQRLMDAKEGRTSSSNVNKKVKIKEKDHGLHKGKGAFVIAYKHFVEMKRSSRLLFIDGYTVFGAVSVGIAGYFIKDGMLSYTILSVLIYIQYFLTVFGRLKLELVKPYIYMIPENSFKKLIAASISSLLKPCADAVVFFTILALVGGADILQCIFMALAYSASGAVFVGLTVLYQRVFGGQPNMIARVFLGIIFLALAIAPGAIASIIIAAYFLPENMLFMATLPYTVICLIEAFIMFFASRNLIDTAEYSGKFI